MLWRSLWVHLGAMIGIGVLKLVVDHNVRIWLFGRAGYLLLTNLAYNLLVYWAIVATAHGIEYYRTGREREVRASQLEARLAEARLQQLSMQLQPHFLFNTLNAIAELVHGSPDTADRMIAGLSVLLRETLADSSARAVPLRRELSLLGCYVDIQRVRFGPRLAVRVDAPPDTLDAAVPALLLQPLVENAIRHGLGSRSSAGRIEIAAARAGDRLTIRVRDDGAGLREGERGREGVGLANTRARLQALFGADVSLDVSSAGQGGVEVAIDIPCRMVDAV
jgi:LytS/YehU family sensor histidine kinase